MRLEERAIDLQPKVRHLLELLLRSDGSVVGKDAMAAALWPGEAVSDNSLSRVVSLLRKALRRGGEDPVKTIYGAGVRLDAEVSALDAPGAKPAVDETRDALFRNAYEMASGRTTAGMRNALRLMRYTVERYPDDAQGWALMALMTASLAVRGSLAPEAAAKQVAEHAARALNCDPRSPDALAASGWGLAILSGKLEEGGRLLDLAFELAPRKVFTCFMRSWLMAEKRDLRGAIGEVENALARVPLERSLLGLRARLLLCAGKFEEADALAQQGLSLRPDIDSLHYVRSVAAGLRGDHTRAVAFAEQAVRISAHERVPLSYLAYALAQAGRLVEAQQTYEAASVGFPVSAFLAPVRLALAGPEAARATLRRAAQVHCPWRSLMWADPRLAPLRAVAG